MKLQLALDLNRPTNRVGSQSDPALSRLDTLTTYHGFDIFPGKR